MAQIWKQVYGEGSADSLLELSGSRRAETIKAQPDGHPLGRAIESERVHDRFVLRVPCRTDESFYGLGLSFHHLVLNHQVRHLRMDHYGGVDNGRTHAPVPFYVSDAGYGVFVDTAEPISFYMAGSVRMDAPNPPPEINRGRGNGWRCEQSAEFVEISWIGKGADVYLFTGDTMTEVVAAFNRLCGGGCLPPKWGLGYWHRTQYQTGAEEALADLDAYEAHGYSVDVIGLEPGWQSASYPGSFVWDAERYPDPAAFLTKMTERGVRVNLWENFFISRSAPFYDAIEPYCGSHRVWGGAVPDMLMAEAREILARHHKNTHIDLGVSGYKIDECDGIDEWLWPDHATFPSGRSAQVMRNVFGARLQRMIEALFRARDQRTYGLVRATNAGAASMPFCLYNDCYAFDEYMTGMLSAGFCGALWTPEIRGAKTADEMARRFQLAALSPMLLFNAWADEVKPWDFPEAEEAIKGAIALRHALLPYLYTAFRRYWGDGIPPFRAMMMDYPRLETATKQSVLDHTDNPYQTRKATAVTDQYMIGDCLLYAPVLPDETRRTVVLPEGIWYDFHTGERVGGDAISVDCPLTYIPLFVKDGGMIPLATEAGLTIRCYGARGECAIYDDDGISYAYEKGACAWIRCAFTRDGGVLRGHFDVDAHGYQTGYTNISFV